MNKYLQNGLRGWTIAAALGVAVVHAQTDTVTVKRATELREAPVDSARSLSPLPLQTPVTRLGPRQGPWVEVRTAQGTSGWVHMFDIGTVTAPAQGGNAATGALRGLTGFFGKGSAQAPNTRTATSTIGIRGLGAEDIANAQPNLEAVARVEAMRQNANQARQFGAESALVAVAVPALPMPPAATRAPSGAAGPAGGSANTGSQR